MDRAVRTGVSWAQIFIASALLFSISIAQDPVPVQVGLKPFLLHSNISRPEAGTFTDDPTMSVNRKPLFLDSFLQYLENSGLAENQASLLEVNIDELLNGGLNITLKESDAEKDFKSTVDLLANALTFVFQEAKKVHFTPRFSCSVVLSPPGSGKPELGVLTLKSSAG